MWSHIIMYVLCMFVCLFVCLSAFVNFPETWPGLRENWMPEIKYEKYELNL